MLNAHSTTQTLIGAVIVLLNLSSRRRIPRLSDRPLRVACRTVLARSYPRQPSLMLTVTGEHGGTRDAARYAALFDVFNTRSSMRTIYYLCLISV